MGLFSGIFMAPFMPIKGTVWVAEKIRDEAERQYYDPGAIRRQLEDVAQARRDGALSEEEAAELEQELVQRLITANRREH